jgi:hypothetical protein
MEPKGALPNRKGFQEQFEPIARRDVVDKDERLAAKELELQKSVEEEESIFTLGVEDVLPELLLIWQVTLFEFDDGWLPKRELLQSSDVLTHGGTLGARHRPRRHTENEE